MSIKLPQPASQATTEISLTSQKIQKVFGNFASYSVLCFRTFTQIICVISLRDFSRTIFTHYLLTEGLDTTI